MAASSGSSSGEQTRQKGPQEGVSAADAEYELPLPRKEALSYFFASAPRIGDKRDWEAVELRRCSRVARWRVQLGREERGGKRAAVTVGHACLSQLPAGYRCTVELTAVIRRRKERAEENAERGEGAEKREGEGGGISLEEEEGEEEKKAIATHTFRKGGGELKTMLCFWPRNQAMTSPTEDASECPADETGMEMEVEVEIDVLAEYVQRTEGGAGGGRRKKGPFRDRPPCRDVILVCPHCQDPFEVASGNCLVFRHGVYKRNNRQISPHSSQATCEALMRDGQIYGCGKPVRAVYDPVKKEWGAEKCGYV